MKLAEGSAVEHEESLAVVEVQVESSSLEAVCGMHHAVLRRVQVTSALLDLDAVKWKDIKLKTFYMASSRNNWSKHKMFGQLLRREMRQFILILFCFVLCYRICRRKHPKSLLPQSGRRVYV